MAQAPPTVSDIGPAWRGAYRTLSYAFRVESDLPAVGTFIGRLFEPFVDERSEGTVYGLHRGMTAGATHSLTRDSSIVASASDGPGMLIDWLITDTARLAVQTTDMYVAVHAAVAGRRDGAIVLPAPPDCGKTTLLAGLVRSGFSFLSDEVALFDVERPWVTPFPRPILIDPNSVEVLAGLGEAVPPECESFRGERYQLCADDLRPGAMGTSLPVSLIVQPRYEAGANPRLEAMSRADALRLLVEQSFNLDRFGGEGIRVLAEIVRRADCYRLTFGDLDEAVSIVRDHADPVAVAD
jgi:hypothetical protein